MISCAVFLLLASSVACRNTWNSQTFSLSDLLERLSDLEHRLQLQEKINAEQERIIKILIYENKKLKDDGMPETGKSIDARKRNEDEGLNAAYGNRTTNDEETTAVYRMHLNLKSKISVDSSSPNKFLLNSVNNEPRKRSVTGGVAFYAYMSHDEGSLGQHQTIIFDHVITNAGGNYNRHTGIFSSPVNGVYTFSWTLCCISDGYIYSEIVVNSNAVGAMYCDGQGALSLKHTTGVVVVEIHQGDVVYIRTHPQDPVGGAIPSGSTYPSSFKGWKLY